MKSEAIYADAPLQISFSNKKAPEKGPFFNLRACTSPDMSTLDHKPSLAEQKLGL
jgi:hypothetical protein